MQMGRPKKERQPQDRAEPMPAIWRVSDELWRRVSPIIRELDPPKQTGRRRIDARGALDAIIFRMRSGCPASGTNFPPTSLMIAPCIVPSKDG